MRESKRGIGPCRVARAIEWILLTVVMSVLHAVPAYAASREAKERQAREACLSGDYQKGVSILSRLFVTSENPVYIFNQGRCFEQNRRYEDAIARFQEFLRILRDRNRPAQEEARKHIAECQAMLSQAETPAAPPPPAAPVETAAPPPIPVPAPAPTVTHEQPEPERTSGSGLKTAGVITAAAGGAALVAGLLLNLKVNSMTDEFGQKDKYTEDKESTRKTYKTLSIVSYGFGAACVATGTVLFLLGRKGPGDSGNVTWAPMLASGQVGAVLGGSF